MRILFGSWPGYGHLLPMVPLIRAAKRAGDDVAVSSGADMAELIGRLGVTAHRSGSRWRSPTRDCRMTRRLASYHPISRPDSRHVIYSEQAPSTAPGMYSRFLSMIGSMIGDAGLPDPSHEIFAAPYLDICPRSVRGGPPNPWTAIHPLHPSTGEVEPHATLPVELSTLPHPDTVYFTLGTITNHAPTVFRAAINGCARLPINLVVTTGPGFDPAQLEPVPPAVRALRFLPQAAVLPQCRVVVSHAGAGTILGALCHGLPQLCLPQGTDQPFTGLVWPHRRHAGAVVTA